MFKIISNIKTYRYIHSDGIGGEVSMKPYNPVPNGLEFVGEEFMEFMVEELPDQYPKEWGANPQIIEIEPSYSEKRLEEYEPTSVVLEAIIEHFQDQYNAGERFGGSLDEKLAHRKSVKEKYHK